MIKQSKGKTFSTVTVWISILLIVISFFPDIKSAEGTTVTGTKKKLRATLGMLSSYSSNNQDYEIIYIEKHDPQQVSNLNNGKHKVKRAQLNNADASYSFSAFGKAYDIDVKHNKFLVPPTAKIVVVRANYPGGPTLRQEFFDLAYECDHFLHTDDAIAAAISDCPQNEIYGYMVADGWLYEIEPLSHHLSNNYPPVAEGIGSNLTRTHIIRRSFNVLDNTCSCIPAGATKRQRASIGRERNNRLVVELALFMDNAAFRDLNPSRLNRSKKYLIDMVLATINGVQAVYHHPSLGQRLDLAIVHLEIHEFSPKSYPKYDGERSDTIHKFCAYQKTLNVDDGKDCHRHWDMAFLLTGLNLYSKNPLSHNMGISFPGGVCSSRYNCGISQFASRVHYSDALSNATLMAMFSTVKTIAHEIGHNLGLSHDGEENDCDPRKFVMSSENEWLGQVTWSPCSAEELAGITADCLYDSPVYWNPAFDHPKYNNQPGRYFSADEQCRVLLMDPRAYALGNKADRCSRLVCRTYDRAFKHYIVGPALVGTKCGNGKRCFSGQCSEERHLPRIKHEW